MADVAFVFHWPLGDLREMEMEELQQWADLARGRIEALTGK